MTLTDFLTYLTTGGSVIALSWIMENIAWFQSITSDQRRYIQFIGSLALGIVAKLILQYVPADTLSLIAPYFEIAALLFGAVFVNQLAHKVNPWRQ